MKDSTKALAQLSFETRDAEVFKIPDLKTRLATIQNYFFPRLEVLTRESYRLVREIYHLDPIRRRINFVYRPSHRKDAVVNRDYGEVYMGLSGSRARPVPLSIKSAQRQALLLHPDATTLYD